uniref:Pco088261 n=1 Tax=Arundo donax TaxID=35708 RepID=A0A0A9DB01_ARUDO
MTAPFPICTWVTPGSPLQEGIDSIERFLSSHHIDVSSSSLI